MSCLDGYGSKRKALGTTGFDLRIFPFTNRVSWVPRIFDPHPDLGCLWTKNKSQAFILPGEILESAKGKTSKWHATDPPVYKRGFAFQKPGKNWKIIPERPFI